VIRKGVAGVLAVIGLLALSTTGAQAGAGGSPSVLNSFFVCNSISGDDAGRQVNVSSSFWNFNPMNVRIGNATLACAFSKLFDPNTGAEIAPNPGLTKEQLKCYSISVGRQTGNPSNQSALSFTVKDQLLGEDPEVNGSTTQYICAPASFSPNF